MATLAKKSGTRMIYFLVLVCAGCACGAAIVYGAQQMGGSSQAMLPPPPVAEKIPKTVTVHGDSRVDDYFWLRDRQNPKVMEYLKAEDAYADRVMQPTAQLQATLFKEMVGHIKETDQSAPYRRGDYFYYTRTEQS